MDNILYSFISFFRFSMTHLRYPLLAASSLVLLSACGAAKSPDLATMLQNPLYAEQYYDAQVEKMVDVLIGSGAAMKDASVKATIDKTRLDGLKSAKAATDLQAKGTMGSFVSDTQEADGEVLLLDGKLYTGPEFQVRPGADIHVYLSNVLDPRDAAFPDNGAVDIGGVRTIFGAAVYDVPAAAAKYRTVVLYDQALKTIVGFAQLSAR